LAQHFRQRPELEVVNVAQLTLCGNGRMRRAQGRSTQVKSGVSPHYVTIVALYYLHTRRVIYAVLCYGREG
jgi:hypothetical protein